VKKVYVIQEQDYDALYLHGVFSTREKAEEAQTLLKTCIHGDSSGDIKEMELDAFWKDYFTEVFLSKDGRVVKVAINDATKSFPSGYSSFVGYNLIVEDLEHVDDATLVFMWGVRTLSPRKAVRLAKAALKTLLSEKPEIWEDRNRTELFFQEHIVQ
jgi:hypothetical protein